MAREQGTSGELWGTLEELLLACAVKRYGTQNWDTISAELQTRRSSSLPCLTPQSCKEKFNDLKRRFIPRNDSVSVSLDSVIDELRRIRVDDLRREIQQRDVSIVSLELKVKRMKEERERSLKEEADLKIVSGVPTTGARKSDERNDGRLKEKEGERTIPSGGLDESNELRESLVESKREEVKEGVASKRKRIRKSGDGAAGSSRCRKPEGEEDFPAIKRAAAVKPPESLIKFLEKIRSNRASSWFERRLPIQESEKYKNMIRQHIDLQTIESRLFETVYSDCVEKFFRDFLLMFNNAIVFYENTSTQHFVALILRPIVLKEMKDKQRKLSQLVIVKPEPDQLPISSIAIENVCGLSSIGAKSFFGSRNGDRKDKERSVLNTHKNLSSCDKDVEKHHKYRNNELSSGDAPEIKMESKDSTSKERKSRARSLKIKNDDDINVSGEEKKRGRNRDGRGSERVCRSSARKVEREDNRKIRKGVGRPRKRATAEVEEKRETNSGENEVGVGCSGRPRKKLRR